MGVLVGLLAFIVLILFVFGIINIVYPVRRLGIRSRWYGVGIVVVSTVGMWLTDPLMEATNPEYAAEKEAERIAEAEADSLRDVEKARAVELEMIIEKYAGWIEEHGRSRAGEMINEEIDAAFKAKDSARAELLSNASATAMLQDSERSKLQQAKREAEIQEKVNAQFSPWDGSHRILVEAVKKTLNDPGSFEHLETKNMRGTAWPETFVVRMEYTAKNAFGGRVRKYVLVEISVETGRITQVLDEG